MNFPKLLYDVVPKLPRLNLKPWGGFWATDAMKNPRDLYWKITGEPQTDPMDFMGCFNTTSGEAMEETLAKKWFSKLGPHGLFLFDQQIYLGETDPITWSGKADFLFMDKDKKFYLKEMKTAYGTGGEWLLNRLTPKDDQAAQLALYARALHRQNKRVESCSLVYFIYGNNAQTRSIIEFSGSYQPDDDTFVFDTIVQPLGERPFHYVVKLNDIFTNWALVLKHVKEKTVPPATHLYKYPVTESMIKNLKDYELLQAIEGTKVHGDWQIEYSSYKKLHLSLTKDKPFYSIDEIRMFEKEYLTRHPKSKKFQ